MKVLDALKSLDNLLDCTDSGWDNANSVEYAEAILKFTALVVEIQSPVVAMAAMLTVLKLHVKTGIAAMEEGSQKGESH